MRKLLEGLVMRVWNSPVTVDTKGLATKAVALRKRGVLFPAQYSYVEIGNGFHRVCPIGALCVASGAKFSADDTKIDAVKATGLGRLELGKIEYAYELNGLGKFGSHISNSLKKDIEMRMKGMEREERLDAILVNVAKNGRLILSEL